MLARFTSCILALCIWHCTNAQYIVRIRDIDKKPPIDTCEIRITYLIQFPMDTIKRKESFDVFNWMLVVVIPNITAPQPNEKTLLCTIRQDRHSIKGTIFRIITSFSIRIFIGGDAASCTVWTRFNWTEMCTTIGSQT